jgi:hypothetical protein
MFDSAPMWTRWVVVVVLGGLVAWCTLETGRRS